jgi:hypothetical protein
MMVIALALALLTGGVAGHLTAVVSSGVSPTVFGDQTERVQAFYDGMNQYLATGDDAFLRLLAPGFQAHSTVDGAPGSADDLLARLDTLRRSALPPRFTVEEIHELGSLVEVRVSTGVPASFDVAGLSVATALPPSVIEFVQLQGDAIVAHWSQSVWIPDIGQTLDSEVSLDAVYGFAFDVSQVALDPSAEFALPRTAFAWLLVETGRVAIDDGVSRLRLETGESRHVTGSGPARIRNPESEQAVVWLVSLEKPNSPTTYAPSAGELPPGVTIAHLAWGSQFDPAVVGHARIRLARATVPPGSQLMAERSGAASAIAVIDGELEATVQQGIAFHCRPDGLAATVRGHEPIPAGEGIAALPDASPSYRVSGSTPATLLVLTIQPIA